MAAESVPQLKRIGSRTLRVPGSKSLTLRAMTLGALGAGRSVLSAPLESDDGTVIRACNNSVISATFMGLHAYAALHNIDTSKPKPLPLKTAKDAKGNEEQRRLGRGRGAGRRRGRLGE